MDIPGEVGRGGKAHPPRSHFQRNKKPTFARVGAGAVGEEWSGEHHRMYTRARDAACASLADHTRRDTGKTMSNTDYNTLKV